MNIAHFESEFSRRMNELQVGQIKMFEAINENLKNISRRINEAVDVAVSEKMSELKGSIESESVSRCSLAVLSLSTAKMITTV